MLKKIAVFLLTMFVMVGVPILLYVGMIKTLIAAGAHQRIPVTPVTTIELKAETWHPALTSVGTLSAVQGVTVSSQLDGTVTAIHFESGAKVNAGDLLVEMDVGPEKAQLRAAEANLHLAQLNLKRSRELLQRSTISQAQMDTDQANEAQLEAQADNIRATIAKKTVRAPFAGRLGVRLIDLGQTLKAGDAIVSLQAMDPIYADFYLPQQQLHELSAGLGVNVLCDAFPGQAFEGRITAINPEIDAATRNVRVQATLSNVKEQLRPGMFVGIKVELPHAQEVLAIPQTAVLYAPFGDSVFVVIDAKDPQSGEPIKIARQKFVRLGRTQGDFVAVTSGLSAGETLITSGVFKLRPNAPVAPNAPLAPVAERNPRPSDT